MNTFEMFCIKAPFKREIYGHQYYLRQIIHSSEKMSCYEYNVFYRPYLTTNCEMFQAWENAQCSLCLNNFKLPWSCWFWKVRPVSLSSAFVSPCQNRIKGRQNATKSEEVPLKSVEC